MLRCRWGGAAAELCLDSCCLAGECIRVSVSLAWPCVCAISFLAGCHLCRNACSCMCALHQLLVGKLCNTCVAYVRPLAAALLCERERSIGCPAMHQVP